MANFFDQFDEAPKTGNFFDQFDAKPVAPKEEKSGFLRQVADVPLGIGKGAATGVRMIADAFGAGSGASEAIKGVEGYLSSLMSAQAKNDEKEVARIMKDAEDKGVLDQVKAGFKAFSVAPVDLLSQGFGTAAAPVIGMLGGKLLGAGALGLSAIGTGIGAGMGAGSAKGGIYEEVKAALKESGIDEAKAEQAAIKAQEYGGKNLDQILLSAGLGGVAGRFGVESAAKRILTRAAAKETGKGAAREVAEGAARTAATESVPELLQGSQEQVAKNIALQREGFDVPTMRGVAGSGTLEALAGAGLGAVTGSAEAGLRRQARGEAERILAEEERARAEAEKAKAAAEPPPVVKPTAAAPSPTQAIEDQAAELERQQQRQQAAMDRARAGGIGGGSEVNQALLEQARIRKEQQERAAAAEEKAAEAERQRALRAERVRIGSTQYSADPMMNEVLRSRAVADFDAANAPKVEEAKRPEYTPTKTIEQVEPIKQPEGFNVLRGLDSRNADLMSAVAERRAAEQAAAAAQAKTVEAKKVEEAAKTDTSRADVDQRVAQVENFLMSPVKRTQQETADYMAGVVPEMQKDFLALFDEDMNQPLSPEQTEALKTQIRQRLQPDVAPEEAVQRTPFKRFLAAKGMNKKDVQDIFGENAYRANQQLPGAIKADGPRLDMLAEAAVEAGFLQEEDTEALVEMIKAEFGGDAQVSVDMAGDRAAAEYEARREGELEDRAAAIGLKTKGMTPDQIAARLDRIERKREEKRKQYSRNVDGFADLPTAEQDRIIDMMIDQFGEPQIFDVERAEIEGRVREEEELLQTQNEQQLRDKQAEIDRLNKENERLNQEAERKAKADKEAGDFVLTGSDRVADKAAARGQMDLTEGEKPTREEILRGVKALAEKLLSKGTVKYEDTELGGDVYQVITRTFEGKLYGSELRTVREALGNATEVTLVNEEDQVMTLSLTGRNVGEGANVRVMDSKYLSEDQIEDQTEDSRTSEEIKDAILALNRKISSTLTSKGNMPVKGSKAYETYQALKKERDRLVKKFDKAEAREKAEAASSEEPGEAVDENDTGFIGASDKEVADVAEAFDLAAKRQDYDKVTRVFDAPEKGEIVRAENKTQEAIKDSGYMTVKQAKQRIEEWKKNAKSQSGSRANSEKVVLSLFDTTGEWSRPWEEAGYQVYRFDIQDDPEFGDVNKFSSEFFSDLFGAFEGQDVYAILAACPCTDFASSGARHFAAKDADGRTVESVKLVQQTLATVEYFKPSVWAIENPVGRIEKLTGLPPWRLSFNPNHFGDPYTKKTLLWGRFNADLPIAPVEPVEGSKMHRLYGGKSQATKNARSVTPEGFAYAFFEANNAIDNPVMAVANKYDMLDRSAVEAAVNAKMTDQEIADVVDDPYYFDLDYDAASAALQEAADNDQKPMLAAETGKGYNISAEDQRIEKELTGKSMIQAADWAVANAPNAFAKVIAEKVRNRLREFQRKGMTLEFNISGGSTRSRMLSGARGVTQFEWGKDDKGSKITVTLNGAAVMDNQAGYPPGVQYNTILHELLHVATRSQFVFMPNTDPLKKQMTELFNAVVGRFNADVKAGTLPPVMEKYYKRMNNVLEDPDELLAWGLTDKDVQAYFDDIKVGEKSVFTRLVELIRTALGLGKPYESALERLVRTSESMLDVDVDAIDAMLGQRDKQIGVKKKPTGPMKQESLFQKEGDVRYQREGQPSPARQNIFGEPVLGTWSITVDPKMELQDGLIYKLLDKNIDVKRIVEAVKSTGKEIASKWNPYLQEELYHGRTANASQEFRDNEWLPLLQDMEKKGVTVGELEKYLLNRHAEDYNKLMAQRNPDRPEMQDGASSVNTADARNYLAGLDKDTKAKYDELAKRVDGITKGTRKLLADTGYEKAKTIEAWEEMFPNYVPLMREEDDFDYNFASFGTGRGFDVRRDFSRSAMGSKRNVVDIIGNVISARNQAISLTEKNRVAQAVYGLALEAPNPDFWLPINPDLAEVREVDRIKQNIAKYMAKKFDPNITDDELDDVKSSLESEYKKLKLAKTKATEAIERVKRELVDLGIPEETINTVMQEPEQRILDPKKGQVVKRINTKLRENDHVLATRINGEKRYVFFNPKDPRSKRAATALKNLDAQDLGTALGMIAKVTRWMASVNTQYNPIFGPYNFLRDVQSAALQLSTTELAGQQKDIAKYVVPSLRVIYSSLRKRRKGEAATGEMADLWKEFQKEGGQTGFKDNFSRTQDRTEALLDEMSKITEGKVKANARAVFDWLSDYNDSLENAVRLSAYKVAKEKFAKEGFSDSEAKQKAASLAKNLTVNFNRKGDVATQMGALYAFFNASMQGTARMIETLKGPTGKKILAGGLLLGGMQAALLAAAGFDDEEPPEFIRSKNIVIPTGDGDYVAFPMPLGFHVIPGFSRILTEWTLSGFKDTARRVTDLTGLFLDAFNPIGNAGWSVQTITPTILDPLVALGENKDWTGKPISKEDIFALRPTPGYTRAREGANWLSTNLAEFLNYASGGDEDRKGVLSPTPEQIEYLVGQVFGGVGREAIKLATTVEKTATGEELPPYKIPLYGRFVGETKSSAAESNRFYKNMMKLNELQAVVDGRRERKQPIGDFMKDNPEARLLPMANKTYKDVQALRKRRAALVERDAPKESVQAVEKMITRKMQVLNDRVRALEESN